MCDVCYSLPVNRPKHCNVLVLLPSCRAKAKGESVRLNSSTLWSARFKNVEKFQCLFIGFQPQVYMCIARATICICMFAGMLFTSIENGLLKSLTLNIWTFKVSKPACKITVKCVQSGSELLFDCLAGWKVT